MILDSKAEWIVERTGRSLLWLRCNHSFCRGWTTLTRRRGRLCGSVVEEGLQEGLHGLWLALTMQRGNAGNAFLHCCSRFSTAPPTCCCTVMHYDGGLLFSSISPECNELGGGRGPPGPLPSGVVQELGPWPGWVAPITPMEGSSRGGPGWPRPAGSNCEFSRREIKRSSSSPNSPPIRLGSPTTITSCNVHYQILLQTSSFQWSSSKVEGMKQKKEVCSFFSSLTLTNLT